MGGQQGAARAVLLPQTGLALAREEPKLPLGSAFAESCIDR